MQYIVLELLYNVKYITYFGILSLKCINKLSHQTYHKSYIKKYISIHMLKTSIKTSGIDKNLFLLNLNSADLIEIFNIFSQQYYNNIFSQKYKISRIDQIKYDNLYPMAWYKKKNYRLSEILRLDNLIKNNKNLDAILNYPRPPRNYQYYE